jgi:protease I
VAEQRQEGAAVQLDGLRVAILTANDGVERVELEHPRSRLEQEKAEVVHLTPEGGAVRTFEQTDPHGTADSDGRIGAADPANFDLLLLPGGYVNPDLLRRDEQAVSFVRAFFEDRKPVAVICHGPWTLIEADVVRGRSLAAVESLKTDIRNAGGEWVDEDVHVDRGDSLLVSGRNYQAVEEFVDTLTRELAAAAALH